MTFGALPLALALAVAPASHTDAPSSVRLGRVEARLFYEETGRLSDDLLARPKPFIAWNTIIGEGDAEEAANDMLVTVRIEGDKFANDSQEFINSPIDLTVTGPKGQLLGSRRWPNLLTSSKGVVVLPLWVKNVGCAGAVTIEARYNGATKTGHLAFDCGE